MINARSIWPLIVVVAGLCIGGWIWHVRHEYEIAAHSFSINQDRYDAEAKQILAKAMCSPSRSQFNLANKNASLSDRGTALVKHLRDGTLTVWFPRANINEYYVKSPRPFRPDEFRRHFGGPSATFDYYYTTLSPGWYLVQENRP